MDIKVALYSMSTASNGTTKRARLASILDQTFEASVTLSVLGVPAVGRTVVFPTGTEFTASAGTIYRTDRASIALAVTPTYSLLVWDQLAADTQELNDLLQNGTTINLKLLNINLLLMAQKQINNCTQEQWQQLYQTLSLIVSNEEKIARNLLANWDDHARFMVDPDAPAKPKVRSTFFAEEERQAEPTDDALSDLNASLQAFTGSGAAAGKALNVDWVQQKITFTASGDSGNTPILKALKYPIAQTITAHGNVVIDRNGQIRDDDGVRLESAEQEKIYLVNCGQNSFRFYDEEWTTSGSLQNSGSDNPIFAYQYGGSGVAYYTYAGSGVSYFGGSTATNANSANPKFKELFDAGALRIANLDGVVANAWPLTVGAGNVNRQAIYNPPKAGYDRKIACAWFGDVFTAFAVALGGVILPIAPTDVLLQQGNLGGSGMYKYYSPTKIPGDTHHIWFD